MEEKTKSIEYKFKMMTASIQESLVSLFDVIKPYIEKAIDLITKLSDAFRNLSDGDKLELAKLAGLVTILPTVIVAFGTLIMVIGKIATAFIALALAPIKFIGVIFKVMEAIGKFKTLVAGKGFLEGLIVLFPKLEGVITTVYVAISNLATKIAGVFTGAGTAGGLLGGFKAILLLGAKVIGMAMLIAGAFTFLKDLLSNWSDLGFFASFEHAFVNLVNKVVDGISKIVGILNEDWGESIQKNFTIESSADKYAKELGYDGYDEMKNSKSALSSFQDQLNKITNGDYNIDFGINFDGFDGITGTVNNWSNGAIGRLIEGMNNGSVEEVSADTVNDYKESVSDVIGQYEYIQNLKKQGNKALEDENKLTQKMVKTREEMAKHSKDCADYQKLQNEYNELYEQKKQKSQFRIDNQNELDTKLKEYEENALVISVKYEEAKKNGLGDEFFYNNFGQHFQEKFGVELVFKNKEESVNSLNKLKENIPELKEGIEIELQTADGEYKNQLMSSLVELEKLELSIPVALDIVDTENKLLKFFGENNELDKSKNKESELKTTLSGLKKGSKAWEETNKQYKEAQKNTKNLQTEYDGLIDNLNKLKEKNPQVFDNATQLAKALTGNPNSDLTNFLTGDKYVNGNANNNSKAKKFISENYNKNGSKKTEEQKQKEKKEERESSKDFIGPRKETESFIGPKPLTKAQQKEIEKKRKEAEEYASQYNYVNPHGMPILPGNTGLSDKTKNKLNEKYGKNKDKNSTTTVNNDTPITDNVKKDIEGAQEVANSAEIEMPTVISGEKPTLITENVEKDVETAKSSLDTLNEKAQETLSSFGEIDMSNLAEVFSVVLTLADEVRQRLIDIGNVANNSVKSNFSGIADGLFEKLAQVREKLISIGDVANNYVRNNISGMLDGFMENISVAREAVIGLGNVANNYLKNCLNGAGDGLKTSIQSAREVLLSVANVALGRGASSLLAMGQSLSNGLNGAREKLLSICNVAYNRGVSAMSAMGQALSNSLSGAVGIAQRVANIISGAVRQANNIKVPTITTSPSVGTFSLAQPTNLASMMRSIDMNNSSKNTINTNSSSFNFAIDKVITNSSSDLRKSASKLTSYCKRKGLF